MAWDCTVKVLDVPSKLISIRAVRTDAVVTTDVRTYTVINAQIKTGAQRTAVMDNIWQQYQDELTYEAQCAAVVSTLEAAAEDNLENREP
jgi:alpha-D-ribose 1-methylphosphonate 5-triphosphate synthase subunit PhnG